MHAAGVVVVVFVKQYFLLKNCLWRYATRTHYKTKSGPVFFVSTVLLVGRSRKSETATGLNISPAKSIANTVDTSVLVKLAADVVRVSGKR